MRKATKKQANEVYDRFFGTLRCWNGGTVEENLRQAPYCYEGLQRHAAEAAQLVSNPGILLRNDDHLWECISETIPARLESFRKRYGF
jgi:hypothetical protein